MSYYDAQHYEEPVKSGGLKDLAFWSALVVVNVGCVGLMAMLLLR